jgi:hypothetical protein
MSYVLKYYYLPSPKTEIYIPQISKLYSYS